MSTKYTPEDYNTARLHGSYANAAAIARELSIFPDGNHDLHWHEAAQRMDEMAQAYEQGFNDARNFTGLKDIHGRAVLAGDKVWLYPQEYEVISIDDSGPIPVHEVDTTKPKPVPDTPLVRGEVYWSTDQLMWVVKVSWQTPKWSEFKYASVALSHYAVEVHDE